MKRFILGILAFMSLMAAAETIQSNQYAIWGIDEDEVIIPTGSVITEAVLTIKNVSPANAPVYVHLLDNTTAGFTFGTDTSGGNVFDTYGVSLSGTYDENGNYICNLSQINDAQSRIWTVFTQPCTMTLVDTSTVQFTSSLLELMDYAGNGGGLGIGIDNGTDSEITFDSIKLDVTTQTYQGTASSQTLALVYPEASAEEAYALQFDGVDDTATFSSFVRPVNNFTVSAWVKTDVTHKIDIESTSGVAGYLNTGHRYLCKPETISGAAGIGISVGTNGVSVYEFSDSYLPALAVYEGALGSDWNYVTITYTNKQPRIYVNGVLVRTGLTSPKTNVYAPRQLGGRNIGWFKGEVSGFCIWDRPLSDAEVLASATNGFSDVAAVGDWMLDEGTGTIANDSSGSGFNGIISGATWVSLVNAPELKNALQFDGVDDTATFSSFVRPANNFTVSAWVKTNVTHKIDIESTSGTAGYLTTGHRYLCKPETVSNGAGIGISVGTNGVSVYEFADAYLPALAVYEGDLGTSWNYITITYTDKQPRIYVNGNLVHTGLTSLKANVYAPRQLGGRNIGWFKGEVSGFRIWNQSLSDAEVLASATNGFSDVAAVGDWMFNEGTGTIANDSSGSGFNGIISGATWVQCIR